jgi:hypothetical protein
MRLFIFKRGDSTISVGPDGFTIPITKEEKKQKSLALPLTAIEGQFRNKDCVTGSSEIPF